MINLSKNLIGNHDLIINLFNNYHNKILSNSLIFSGLKGIGKATSAFYLINKIYKKLDSKYQTNINLIYNNSHPNIRYLNKKYDKKTNKLKKHITIDQIRDLESFLNQSTFDNLPKFIIIDSADDLNNSSANSLLKSLEEPKNNTYFILIAHQISNLLPTIRSRCLNYVFYKPSYDEFSQILKINENSLESSDTNFLYYLTNGSSGLALEIYSKNMKDIYNIIIEIFLDKESISLNIFNLANEVSQYSNDEFMNFILVLKFIIISIIKINLGYIYNDSFFYASFEYLTNVANHIPNSTSLEILEFLNENEKDLFIYNLDKKIFCFNIFNSLCK